MSLLTVYSNNTNYLWKQFEWVINAPYILVEAGPYSSLPLEGGAEPSTIHSLSGKFSFISQRERKKSDKWIVTCKSGFFRDRFYEAHSNLIITDSIIRITYLILMFI